ncbi:MAG: hypothetical protein ACT4PM_13720 [Gemmatimonadales bacterium]
MSFMVRAIEDIRRQQEMLGHLDPMIQFYRDEAQRSRFEQEERWLRDAEIMRHGELQAEMARKAELQAEAARRTAVEAEMIRQARRDAEVQEAVRLEAEARRFQEQIESERWLEQERRAAEEAKLRERILNPLGLSPVGLHAPRLGETIQETQNQGGKIFDTEREARERVLTVSTPPQIQIPDWIFERHRPRRAKPVSKPIPAPQVQTRWHRFTAFVQREAHERGAVWAFFGFLLTALLTIIAML